MDGVMSSQAAEAAAAGNYRKALKELDQLCWPSAADDVVERLEAVAAQANEIARATDGRTAKKAAKIAQTARENAQFQRDEQARRRAWAQAAAAAETASASEYEISPVSVAVGLVAAGLLLMSIFLPRVESTTFGRVADNTLIQSGDGWIFIGLAIAVAASVGRAYYAKKRAWSPAVFGLVAVGVAIYDGTNKSALQLCPVNQAATQLGLGCSTASPSVGIYMAGIGGALAVLSGLMIVRWSPIAELAPMPKTNVDQSETVTSAPAASAEESQTIESRLRTLENLRAHGLLDEAEYLARRTAVLDQI